MFYLIDYYFLTRGLNRSYIIVLALANVSSWFSWLALIISFLLNLIILISVLSYLSSSGAFSFRVYRFLTPGKATYCIISLPILYL